MTQPLWSSVEAAHATGGTTGSWQATGVSIDTRTLAPGDLFVALTAARDGHDFVRQALDAGAAAALVSRIPEGCDPDRCLIVSDVQSALEALGQAARGRTGALVVAVTGSVGKTSTKEMLRAALAPQGSTHASVASYNNHWGVPLTLARMPAEADFAILELGMNHPGEIAPLARQVRPDVALITTIGEAHLEALGSIEAIAREKASICEGLATGGTAILPNNLPTSPILITAADETGARVVSFGSNTADYTLGEIRVAGDVTTAPATTPGGPALLKVRSPGRHFAMNALAALAACDALRADPARSLLGLSDWQPPKGRGTREAIPLDAVETQLTIELIDDAYNANPTSMVAALTALAETPTTGRRIAVLGDMKELGPGGPAAHAALASHPNIAEIDRVHTVGPLMANLQAALPEHRKGNWCETAAEFLPDLHRLFAPGDVVLVKASLSTGLGPVVEAIRTLGSSRRPKDP